MPASMARVPATRCGSSGATTMKVACGGIAPNHSELQGEIDQPLFVPIDFAKVKLRCDESNLISDPMRHQRRIGIIKDDALFVVEPTGPLVDLGNDGVEAERQDAIFQMPSLGIEDFAFPGKV